MSGMADDATGAAHQSGAPRGLGSRAPTTALAGWGRKQSASLYDVFVLAVAMLDGRPVDEILQLAMDEVPRLLDCRPEGCYMLRNGRFELEATPSTRTLGGRAPRDLPDPVEQLTSLGGEDGAVRFREGGWGWAVGLRNSGGLLGYLLVSAGKPPPDEDRFLVYALAQPTGAALYNAEARSRDREYARQLFRAIEERDAVNERLTALVAELEGQRTVHDVLARTSVTDEGEHGIAAAVYELTGLATRVEDRFGNLLAQEGPVPPEADTKPDPLRREQLMHDAMRELGPIRHEGRLIGLARHHGEVLGIIALIDPDGTAGGADMFALEHACTALSLELAHRRSLAEAELRLRRELVDDLLTGADDGGAYARAEAVGHDLHGPHHVTVAQWWATAADDRFLGAVGRAAQALGLRSLLARRGDMAVLVVRGEPRDSGLYEALADEVGSTRGAVGIGSLCEAVADIPRSFDQAVRALAVRRQSHPPDGTTTCEELGLYRILARDKDAGDVTDFVREWLGALLDYDDAHGTDLVHTLTRYFDHGGNYDETAQALAVHRSTLRYRLQRIREVSGRRLDEVDSRFNLQVATRIWKVSGPAW
ncbi:MULTISPECIES: CdaR family transcriptional regulator [unclassified Streptomyces]|uniref:PucR family transcriptional regulator n=1 Tax=unclassified Streptomyces TaxID=2593676 RepID=UPI0022565CF4|nr:MULTISPECIES: helix-turn-helix domain-containing protein [unclassified Streptomyces]MCX4405099.1 helix-turn-helix domain-containing protein [Streptomyces sp. NBC_01764]MCX5190352.1 helix-turn-helix domain-containing protein [Streptomyces sp. NBC_00268]